MLITHNLTVQQVKDTHMSRKLSLRRSLVVAALLLLVLVGCAPTRIGVSWAALTTVGERQDILVSYNDFITLVDPSTGDEVTLLNDQGTPRIDPETNQPRQWQITGIQNAQFYALPTAVSENTWIAADYNGSRLFRIDEQLARVENPAGVTIPGQVVADLVMSDDKLFIPYYNNNLQAIDLQAFLENGTISQEWEFLTDNGIWDAPLLHEGVLYFGSMNHIFYAVDADNGTELWKLNLEGAIAGTPVLHNDKLYVGSFARKIFEISLDGEILRTFTTQNWVWGSPVVQDDVLYAADMGGFAYALDVSGDEGETIPKKWEIKATGRGIRPSPLVAGDYVIVAGREGQIDWINKEDGMIAFFKNAEAEILSDILLIESTEELAIPESLVVVSTINPGKLLMAFRLSDGAQSWVYAR
jgi:outer membrane protein assembly factor BamB